MGRRLSKIKKNKKTTKHYQDIHAKTYNDRNSKKEDKRKVQGVSQSQTAALSRHQAEEETNKTKQAQIEQTYEKH